MNNITPPLSEVELVSLLQKKDPLVIKALYDKYGGAVYGVICRIIPDHITICNQLLKETYLHVWDNALHYSPEKGRLFIWIMNIARRHAITCRDSNNLGDTSFSLKKESGILPAIGLDDIELSSVAEVFSKDSMEVLNMVYLKGYTILQTAEALGITKQTVRKRLRLACLLLRPKM